MRIRIGSVGLRRVAGLNRRGRWGSLCQLRVLYRFVETVDFAGEDEIAFG